MPSTSDNSNSSTPASGAEVESSSADIHSLASWVKAYMEEKGLGDFDEMTKDIKIPAFYVQVLNSYVEDTTKGLENAENKLDDLMRRTDAYKRVILALEKKVEAFQTLVDGQAALIVELYRAAELR